MRFSKSYSKDIFCLEGDWNKNLKKQTGVQAVLLFLKQNRDINSIHRHCGTRENLKYYLQKAQERKYKNYSIIYLAFHGKPGEIILGKDKISLDDLAEMLGPDCHNKVIHFGTCHTLNTDLRNIKRFLRKTNALCVCGFGKEIPFVEGSVFDILLIDMMQEFRNVGTVLNRIKKYYSSLAKKLEFKLVYLK